MAGKELSPKQRKAIDLMVWDDKSQSEVALILKVNINTVNRWVRRDPAFQAALDAELEVMRQEQRYIFRLRTQRAVDTLCDLMENAKDEVKLKAATEVLHQAYQADSDISQDQQLNVNIKVVD